MLNILFGLFLDALSSLELGLLKVSDHSFSFKQFCKRSLPFLFLFKLLSQSARSAVSHGSLVSVSPLSLRLHLIATKSDLALARNIFLLTEF